MFEKKALILQRNNCFYLDSSDYQVLSILYKPVIGFKAFNLYEALYNLSLMNDRFDLQAIKDSLSDDEITDEKIEKYIATLRYVQLLYFENNTFELFAPYLASEFFISPLFPHFKNAVSLEYLNEVANTFGIESYDAKNEKVEPLSSLWFKMNPKENKKTISFEELKRSAKEVEIKIDDNDKPFFLSLSNLYSLDIDQIIRMIIEVSDDDNHYKKDDLIKKAFELFEKEKEREERRKNETHSDKEYINYFLNYNPESILDNGSHYASISDKKTLERLRSELNVKDELITVLFVYSLSTNDNKLHSFAFFDKIVKDWNNKKIETAEDAYHYINEHFKPKKQNSKEIKSAEEVFNDYWDKIIKEASDK